MIQINQTFGCARFVYNHFLALRSDSYKQFGKTVNYYECNHLLTVLKKQNDVSWLRDVDSTSLQNAIRNLDSAYQNFFKKNAKYPNFKSKKQSRQSYRTTCINANIKVFDKAIQLPKLGLVKCRVSKQIRGRILSATISRNPTGKYFVSVVCRVDDVAPLDKTGKTVGIDLGLHDAVICSDGTRFENHKFLTHSVRKLKREQRRLSRKQRGSNNYVRAKKRVAQVHENIANQRLDATHKLTITLVRTYDVICMENLAVSNMMKKHKLARSIADVSWGEIKRQLEYKCDWYGKELVVVDRFFPSSKTCSVCGYVSSITDDLKVRAWVCPVCDSKHDRDVNAARNIHIEGMRLMHVIVG